MMKDITSKDILQRFKEYADNNGYTLKVVGDYAYRNKKLKIMRYVRYSKDDNKIVVYEEGAGQYRIPFVQTDIRNETTFQKNLLRF